MYVFLSNGVIPIFVHDGEPPEEKSEVLSKELIKEQN